MNPIVSVVLAAAVMAAIIGAVQLAMLAFRNPFRSRWLRGGSAETWATVAMVMLFSLAACYLIDALVTAGIPAAAALVGAPVFVVGVFIALWRLIDGRERLRRADAGQSPFGDGVAEPGVPRQA